MFSLIIYAYTIIMLINRNSVIAQSGSADFDIISFDYDVTRTIEDDDYKKCIIDVIKGKYFFKQI